MATEDSRDGISHESQTSMRSSTGDAAVGGVAFQSGRRWADHLSIHPEDGCRCDWARLTGWDWVDLLSVQPQFADKCDWTKLDSRDWVRLLAVQPQFADRCHFSKLDWDDWPELLSVQPQFSERCNWNRLYSWFQAQILALQPQLADRCNWSKFDGNDWAELLAAQPQFAEKCDWDKLDGADWIELLNRRPEFAGRCDWSRLTFLDWEMLLSCRPEFVDRCDFRGLPPGSLLFILARHPHLESRCDMGVFSKEELEFMQDIACDEGDFLDLTFSRHCAQDHNELWKSPFLEWAKRHDVVRRTFIGFALTTQNLKKEDEEKFEEGGYGELHPYRPSIDFKMGVRRSSLVHCKLRVARINHEKGKTNWDCGGYCMEFSLDGMCTDDFYLTE